LATATTSATTTALIINIVKSTCASATAGTYDQN
jgi:hypothetical protein